jgi:hypothetical protein
MCAHDHDAMRSRRRTPTTRLHAPHTHHAPEGIATPRPEWRGNRLEAHLSDVLRQLADAFNKGGGGGGGGGVAGSTAGSTGASGTAAAAGGGVRGAGGAVGVPMPTAAGLDLLQVRVACVLRACCVRVACVLC